MASQKSTVEVEEEEEVVDGVSGLSSSDRGMVGMSEVATGWGRVTTIGEEAEVGVGEGRVTEDTVYDEAVLRADCMLSLIHALSSRVSLSTARAHHLCSSTRLARTRALVLSVDSVFPAATVSVSRRGMREAEVERRAWWCWDTVASTNDV
jgi:hypothetical protein